MSGWINKTSIYLNISWFQLNKLYWFFTVDGVLDLGLLSLPLNLIKLRFIGRHKFRLSLVSISFELGLKYLGESSQGTVYNLWKIIFERHQLLMRTTSDRFEWIGL